MLVCDARETWTQFLEFVKTKCSLTTFGNWFLPIRVLESTADEITLEVPNVFVQDYLLSNYKKDLCAFLPVNSLGDPAIRFVIAPSIKKSISITHKQTTELPEQGAIHHEVKLNQMYRFENFIENSSRDLWVL